MAIAGHVRLSSGRMEARAEVAGSLAWVSAERMAAAMRRLSATETAWAVSQGKTWGERAGGVRAEVKRWTPVPLPVAWRVRQTAARA